MDLFDKKKTKGIFFEAGAVDGVTISNTLQMEFLYNWTGSKLIHPLRELFKYLIV